MHHTEFKALRERLHVTQKEIAKLIGVEPNTVARWERGESSISDSMALQIKEIARTLPSGDAVAQTASVEIDPHHGAILDGLEGKLDPHVFELCAAELLQRDWPRLVWISGGRDDGFDGAVADERANEPFPLIVTIGQRPVRNLAKSLDQAKSKGWTFKRAILATSRRITPATRRKLFDAARSRGVKLQTYDRDWFAGRLYHEPALCKKLLGITGRPCSLSIYPQSQRPVLGTQVLGREREMQWLLVPGRRDCVLAGEPGSGKTFLLRSLALQGKAHFLVNMNREQVANDIRSLGPSSVVVDDAHVHPEWITELLQIRCQLRADFRIIAVSWLGNADEIRSTLNVSSANLLELSRIDADTMIAIIRGAGIEGPDSLLWTIRKQAAGRPGLAVTLAHLCILGDIDDVVSGEGLVRQLGISLREILGEGSLSMLAPFALGGKSGAWQEEVAECLRIPQIDLADALAKLAASGVIVPKSESPFPSSGWSLVVEPTAMRGALVRRAFYRGAGSLNIDRFLPAVCDPADALETLIAARSSGATIPDLENRLDAAKNEGLWCKYAQLGAGEMSFVLDRYPSLIVALARPALAHIPKTAIPRLLSAAVSEISSDPLAERLALVRRNPVMEALDHWISESSWRTNGALEERELLLFCLKDWWNETRNSRVATYALCLAFNPLCRFARTDPGIGNQVVFSDGALPPHVLNRLEEMWLEASDIVQDTAEVSWPEIVQLLQCFFDPLLISDERRKQAANGLLRAILSSVGEATRKHPGVQSRLQEVADFANIDFRRRKYTDFDCIYPPRRDGLGSCEEEQNQSEYSLQRLAESWRDLSVSEMVSRLVHIESEARLAGISYSYRCTEFSAMLAREVPDPVAAARALMQRKVSTSLLEPFVGMAISLTQPEWSIVRECLEHDMYSGIGVTLVLSQGSAPPDLLDAAIARAPNSIKLVEQMCARGVMSEITHKRLLRCRNGQIELAAAIGYWISSTERQKTQWEGEIARLCKDSILRSVDPNVSKSEHEVYWIGKILEDDKGLAVEWLIRLLGNSSGSIGYSVGELAATIAANLSHNDRRKTLHAVSPTRGSLFHGKVMASLIGDSLELYSELLNIKPLKNLHLAPLSGKPGPGWSEKAVMARKFGYSVEDVIGATQCQGHYWIGEESKMWKDWRIAFERLADYSDPRIAEISTRGTDYMHELETSARKRDREIAIHGYE